MQDIVGGDCSIGDLDEVQAYQNSSTQVALSKKETSASPRKRRYFKCSLHYGFTFNRFEVFHPDADDMSLATVVEDTPSPTASPVKENDPKKNNNILLFT